MHMKLCIRIISFASALQLVVQHSVCRNLLEESAVTITDFLDYQPDGLGANYRNEKNPVDADLVVVDEMSMADIRLFDMLLAALKTGTKLILVGDVNQLESVGAGSVLNDLMGTSDLFIEKNCLTEVFRQKGGSPI